ncbi:hypothetical protein AVEN_28651-1 [Araneus ventricosus]|uniref:Uncharacterized protein n=1 Tax=Araneus ventricosus TaxID=182803 RepID=A0A4Y2FJ15_ARAVE|nr:hypothetical protein AVEN_28651-1 [Araneus ventricosus]
MNNHQRLITDLVKTLATKTDILHILLLHHKATVESDQSATLIPDINSLNNRVTSLAPVKAINSHLECSKILKEPVCFLHGVSTFTFYFRSNKDTSNICPLHASTNTCNSDVS